MAVDYRKLISFGKSSFVVSLPKSWIVQNKLKKGDLLYFEDKGSDLVIKYKESNDEEEYKQKIILTDRKDLEQIKRELNAAYIENNREIILKGNELKAKSEELLAVVRGLIALEVLEINSEKIVTKDFLDMDKVSILELIKKMDIIVRSMLNDCSSNFVSDNTANISLRDDDVNRLSFLIYRVIRYGLRNPGRILKNFSLSAVDLLNYYWLTFHIEAIADEAKRISRSMSLVALDRKMQQEFEGIIKETGRFYLETIKSHYTLNIETALQLSNSKAPLIRKINAFFDKNRKVEEAAYLVDRSRRLIGSIHEMGRLVYQH